MNPWYLFSRPGREAIKEGVKDALLELTEPWLTRELRISVGKYEKFEGYIAEMASPLDVKLMDKRSVPELIEMVRKPKYNRYTVFYVIEQRFKCQRNLMTGKITKTLEFEQKIADYSSKDGYTLSGVQMKWPSAKSNLTNGGKDE